MLSHGLIRTAIGAAAVLAGAVSAGCEGQGGGGGDDRQARPASALMQEMDYDRLPDMPPPPDMPAREPEPKQIEAPSGQE